MAELESFSESEHGETSSPRRKTHRSAQSIHLSPEVEDACEVESSDSTALPQTSNGSTQPDRMPSSVEKAGTFQQDTTTKLDQITEILNVVVRRLVNVEAKQEKKHISKFIYKT